MEQGERRDVIIRKEVYLSGSFHHDPVIVVEEEKNARIGLNGIVGVKKDERTLGDFRVL